MPVLLFFVYIADRSLPHKLMIPEIGLHTQQSPLTNRVFGPPNQLVSDTLDDDPDTIRSGSLLHYHPLAIFA